MNLFLIVLSLWTGRPALASLVNRPENHALYISVLEIDHRDMNKLAVVNIRVFETDITDALKNAFDIQIDFANTKPGTDDLVRIEKYFEDHLTINISGKPCTLKFKSMEKNSDSIWFYFEIESPVQWDEVEVKADYLMELFPTQSNVVSIYHGDQKKFLRITNSNKTQMVSF